MTTVEQKSDFPQAPAASRDARAVAIERMRLLWNSRRFLTAALVLGGFGSMGLAFLIPPRFEATAQLMPPEGQSAPGLAALSALAGSTGALGGLAGEMLAGKNSGALFVGILASRTVEDRLIEQFDLRRLYRAGEMEDARAALAAHSRVVEDHKSGIIGITVTDRDPRLAAAIAQAYVEQLNRLVEQVSTSSARRERIFLEERLRSVKHDLDAAAEKFSTFASTNTAIDIPAQGKAMLEAAATLEGQLIAAEAELHGLEAVYTDQNVRVRALRARITEFKSQLGKMGGQAGVSSASANTGALPYPSIRQLPILGVTYADLFRQTKIQETVYELLTQQYELAKVEEAKEIPSVKVLDAAIVPTKKAYPPRGLFTIAGATLVFAAACAWIFIREAWQQIDPQDPEKRFALEVAATLRSDALRLFPSAAFGRLKARLRAKPAQAAPPVSTEETSEPTTTADLAQAARNGLG